ncbi:alpha/beta hydrolase [Sphingomonas solaris]|uniref:Alpha/beta hydrolase n=1 Tax=Alterirhizorhabdus solaris TaxID=2529389 RepID=A0A558QTY4_9SPHN|nr:alpha/beta hydrolase [Sphingomonas solaris]TVV70588.1 alpha/beta hydrolase [Sphingomonas solaris]
MTDPIRPDVRRFLDYVNALPGPRGHELPPEASRAMFRAMRDVADAPVGELAVIRDLAVPADHGTIRARLYDARETRAPGPVMVFFHGGGFVIGDLDSHEPLCAEFARLLDLPVVAVDYRLAPETPWPAAPDDCEAAARHVAETPGFLGRGVSGLVLAGDSAGGTMTIVTAMALRDRPAAVPVLAQFPIYPSLGRATEFPSFERYKADHFLTEESLRFFGDAYAADYDHWRAVPTLGDLAGLPPALVLTAGLDPIRDEGRAYVAALAAAGVPVVFREAVGTIHGFCNMRKAIPSSQGDIAGALVALKAIVGEAAATAAMVQAA